MKNEFFSIDTPLKTFLSSIIISEINRSKERRFCVLAKKNNMDLMNVYDAIDAMKEMKRYKAPTENYFPTAAEINTYARSNIEGIIPYLLWLEDSLSPGAMETHKEARAALRKVIEELRAEGKIV